MRTRCSKWTIGTGNLSTRDREPKGTEYQSLDDAKPEYGEKTWIDPFIDDLCFIAVAASLAMSPWARQQLVAFRDRLMPPAKTVAGRFPTPSGSRWSDVEMRFASHSQGP